ncbi:MAG: fimbrillin family protein [Bacteroidales bacterium]|nr:fimbrillin family protein [Bacteroidales bacterium]
MKRQLFVIAALAGLTCLAACNEVEPVADPDAPRQAIGIRTLASANTKSAVDGTVFPDGYDMKVSSYHNLGAHPGDGEVAADYFKNVTFTKTGTVWKENKYWPLDGTLDFLCYATAGLKDPTAGIVPAAVWGASGNAAAKVVLNVPDNSAKFDDVLYGAANAQHFTASGNPVLFRHAGTVVCFAAKANLAYDPSTNTGITIDGITVDDAYFSGTLTVQNPGAGGGSGDITAAWSALGDQKAHVAARVHGGVPCAASEPVLSGYNVPLTAVTLSTNPYGIGYVILPAQAATKFTLSYTIHNGKDGDGTALNNPMKYQYTCSGTWAQATKNLYTIDITLNEISIAASVSPWTSASPVSVPMQNL